MSKNPYAEYTSPPSLQDMSWWYPYTHKYDGGHTSTISDPTLTAKDKQVGGNHYKDMAIQPGEYIVKNGIGWFEGNAIKYLTRHKAKGQKQDLEKAIHYIQLAIEEYYS